MQKEPYLDPFTSKHTANRLRAWSPEMACGKVKGVHETPEVTMPHPKYMCNFDGKDIIASKHSQLKTWNQDRFRTTKLGSFKITFLLRKITSPYCMYIYSH